MTKDEILGVAEIAARHAVTTVTVWRWTRRADFPAPVVELAGRRGWRANDVDDWASEHLPLPGDRRSKRVKTQDR